MRRDNKEKKAKQNNSAKAIAAAGPKFTKEKFRKFMLGSKESRVL